MELKRIFLLGYMGSGKSSTATKLARKLGLTHLDLDKEIETATGSSIAEFFKTHGHDPFRQKEREVLLHHLNSGGNYVMATGGGTPCYFDNMAVLNESGITIYLEVNPKTLVQRLMPQREKRPLIAGKNEEELESFVKTQLAEREMYYRKAQIIYSGLSVDMDDLAQRIIDHSK